MKIKCVITDDEPVARKGLQGYVEKIEFLQLEAVCKDAITLNSFLQENTVDLLFLDIEMPYVSGVELLQSLTKPPKVIFTTAYEKYAVKGYELEVIDYLLKPVSFERFLKAANKAAAVLKTLEDNVEADEFFIKVDGKLLKLAWKEVMLVESRENYVYIYTTTGKHLVNLTLRSVTEKMPASLIQVQKSFVVNMAFITGIEGSMIEIGPHRVVISRHLKEEVMEKIINGRLLKK